MNTDTKTAKYDAIRTAEQHLRDAVAALRLADSLATGQDRGDLIDLGTQVKALELDTYALGVSMGARS